MTSKEIILLDLGEVRRRNIVIRRGIPREYCYWQPDEAAMRYIETVRQVLESEYDFHQVIENRGSAGLNSKWPFGTSLSRQLATRMHLPTHSG